MPQAEAIRRTLSSPTGRMRIDADAASGGVLIAEGGEALNVLQVLGEGQLLISRFQPGGDLWLVGEDDLSGVTSIEEVGSLLVPLEGHEGFGSLSPDGDWLSYSSNATGRTEVYALRYPVETASPQPSLRWCFAGALEKGQNVRLATIHQIDVPNRHDEVRPFEVINNGCHHALIGLGGRAHGSLDGSGEIDRRELHFS